MTVDRISPQTVRERMQSPQHETLLVCAYDSDEKFAQNRLEGAMSLDEFRAQAEAIDKDREIVFYCA